MLKTQFVPKRKRSLINKDEQAVLNKLFDRLRKTNIDKYLVKGGYITVENDKLVLDVWRKIRISKGRAVNKNKFVI